MTEIGAYEAKTHLSRLLERVAQGERFTITKHGVPVARLMPAEPSDRVDPLEVVADLRRFRRGRKLGGQALKELIVGLPPRRS